MEDQKPDHGGTQPSTSQGSGPRDGQGSSNEANASSNSTAEQHTTGTTSTVGRAMGPPPAGQFMGVAPAMPFPFTGATAARPPAAHGQAMHHHVMGQPAVVAPPPFLSNPPQFLPYTQYAYAFLPMHAAPPPSSAQAASFVAAPMPLQQHQAGRAKTPPAAIGSRQPTKKRCMADPGKRRKSSSPEPVPAAAAPKKPKKARGRPSTSKKRPPTRTVTIKDDYPNRLVNPLVELPEFPLIPNPPPEYIPNGAEIYKWSELYSCRPDTFPISYYARLLGFDVEHCAPENEPFVELDPEKVPLVKENVFLHVPKKGSFCGNVWNSQDQKLDYMDPVYRAIWKNYQKENLTPASTGAWSTPPSISKACLEFAKQQKIIDKQWTFRFCATEKDEADLKRFCKTDFNRSPGEFVILARQGGVCKGYIHYRFQWYRIDEGDDQKPAAATPTAYGMPSATSVIKKPKVSELVFSIIQVNCPGGERDGDVQEETETKESAGSNVSAEGSKETALSVEKAARTVEVTEKTVSTTEGDEQKQEPATDKIEKTEKESMVSDDKEKPDSAAKDDEKKKNTADSKVESEDPVAEHFLTGSAALVLTALAIEHARRCNIWYGLSQIPTKSIPWFEDFFRMSPLANAQQNSQAKSMPLVCDLQKCSYRYAFLLKRERDSGKTPSTAQPSTSSVQRERMLVRLPDVDDARACMEVEGQAAMASRLSLTKPIKASTFFSSASQKMRSISFGVRVDLPTPGFPLRIHSIQEDDKKEEKVISTSSFKTDPNWEVLRVFPLGKPKEKEKEQEEEESEMLTELLKKQKELVSLEGGFEPQLRSLLTKVIEERKEFEDPDAVKERELNKKILQDYEAVLERRREVDRAWQKQLEQDMDAVCDICADGEVTPDNQILFCEACNVAIHQMCYGIEKVPEGDYYCLACRYFDREKMTQAMARQLERGGEVPKMTASALPICCELCPRKQGAFFRSDTSKETAGNKEGETAKWVHVVCAKWQGLDFKNREEKVIEDLTEHKQSFRSLVPRPRCILCQGNRGAFNKCRVDGCGKWMHVSCARSCGLCTVTHGENAIGPVKTNPWTLCCPEHSNISPEDVPEGSVTIEQLVRAAKEFPVEPDPPPPPAKPPKFHKMTTKERRKYLADPEYEKEFLKIIMTEKLYGVRCEVCDSLEQEGSALTRCKCCGVIFCDSCKFDADGAVKGKEYTCWPCKYIEKKIEAGEDYEKPKCLFCYQMGGVLREGIAKPVIRKSYWHHNKKERDRSLFGRKLWVHTSCTFWQYSTGEVIANPETGRVDCSNIIMSNGRNLVRSKQKCALCCQTGGMKIKCDEEGCRDPREKRGPFNMHVTCARQAGLEVKDKTLEDDSVAFYAKCFRHCDCQFAFRAKLEDLIEIEKTRAGKKLKSESVVMTLAHASRLFNASLVVMQSLGWAWRWAEWWVHYGDNWEPFLEPGEDEERMTKEQLRIVDSTPESRCADARRCRLTALGAALRNRAYDAEKRDDMVALDKALRAMLHTKSLVGPLEKFEIDFFAEWLGRAYRSKSRLLGYGDDKIPVANSGGCIHIVDKSPKFELGSRPIPGKQDLSEGQVFESGINEVDDFLKPILLDDGTVLKPEDVAKNDPSKKRPASTGGATATKKPRKNAISSSKASKLRNSTGFDEDFDDGFQAMTGKRSSPGRRRKSRSADPLPQGPEHTPKRRGRPPKNSPAKIPSPKKSPLNSGKRRGRPPGRPRKNPPSEETEKPAEHQEPAETSEVDDTAPLSSIFGQRIPRKSRRGSGERVRYDTGNEDSASENHLL